MQCLAVLDRPRHVPGGVEDRLARVGESEQPPQLVGVARLRRRLEDPRLQLVVQDVRTRLQRGHLGSQRAVLEQQGRVRQPDRHLSRVLHLHEDVDRPVQLGQWWELLVWRLGERRGARHFTDEVRTVLGPVEQQHVALGQNRVGVGVEHPLVAAPDCHQPHARLRRQQQVPQ